MLTLASAEICGYEGDQHVPLATVAEFLHTATLLHDDVVDESGLRRPGFRQRGLGQQVQRSGRRLRSAFKSWSRTVPWRFEPAVPSLPRDRRGRGITDGLHDTETDELACLEVKSKTAQLFAAACQIGGIVANRPRNEQEALASYGMNIGIAFQLIDDVLDYSAKQAELGKTVGDDFTEGKITLPVILAFLRGDTNERDFWKRVLENLDQGDGDLERARDLMATHGALDDTVERARHYGAVARDALGVFKNSEVKEALINWSILHDRPY